MDEPEVRLSEWRAWMARNRLGDDFDIPDEFGLLGIYVLATPSPSQEEHKHLAPEVIYIGMSSHVTRRMDKTHEAVKRYGQETGDTAGLYLFYSEWLSPWSNLNRNTDMGKSQLAYLQYVERKSIWEYARLYERLPKYNKS
jgi:hypothetical protein